MSLFQFQITFLPIFRYQLWSIGMAAYSLALAEFCGSLWFQNCCLTESNSKYSLACDRLFFWSFSIGPGKICQNHWQYKMICNKRSRFIFPSIWVCPQQVTITVMGQFCPWPKLNLKCLKKTEALIRVKQSNLFANNTCKSHNLHYTTGITYYWGSANFFFHCFWKSVELVNFSFDWYLFPD